MITPREKEVVGLVASGLSTKEVADRLGLSPKTIENHRTNIFKKMKFRSVSDLTRWAVRRGLACLVFFVAFASAQAATTMSWDPVEGANRYRVWIAPTNAPEAATVLTNTTETSVRLDLPPGTWLLSFDAIAEEVTAGATNWTGSGRSDTIKVRQLPKPTGTIRIQFTIQTAPDPSGPWTEQTNLIAALPAAGFYRGKMEIQR